MSAALLCAAGLAGTAQQPDDEWWQIIPGQRVGRITRTSSQEEIIQVFGAENVRQVDVGIGEGETLPGSIVYPDDPTKTIEILWTNSAQGQVPSQVRISGESSRWRTETGLSLGSSLRQIESLNGKAFRLTGFGWDYSGTVLDCNQGRLKELGCVDPNDSSQAIQGRTLLLRLIPDIEGRANREYQAVLGDRDFSSDHAAMQKLNPRVYEMIVSLAP